MEGGGAPAVNRPQAIPPVLLLWHDPANSRESSPMSERLSISALVFFVVMALLGAYFAFAAVQGPSGVLRREQLKADTRELISQRDKLQAEVDRMRNLTRRLSDEFLDLDLLDERARDVLGYIRPDEIIIR